MVNAIIDFSKLGFGDTQMFGLLAKRPELLKRAAAMLAYFLGGEGGLIEPELVELMRLRGANLNARIYCATVCLQPVADAVKAEGGSTWSHRHQRDDQVAGSAARKTDRPYGSKLAYAS